MPRTKDFTGSETLCERCWQLLTEELTELFTGSRQAMSASQCLAALAIAGLTKSDLGNALEPRFERRGQSPNSTSRREVFVIGLTIA